MIRRATLTLALLLFALAAVPAVAAQSTATDTIRQTVNEVLDIIKKPEMSDPAKKDALLQQVEDRIKTIFDFTEFSVRTVGPKWREFTPDQKSKFEEAFAALLRATYIEKLDGYNGEQVDFTGEISSTKGDKAEVQSSIQMKDKPIPVAYRLLIKNGEWKVYDVRIENVSLIENYRGQFKDILLRGSADDLIKKVEEKAREVKNEIKTAKQ